MKKILSFILAALMTASCAAYVAADDAAVEETTSNAAQDYAIEFLANYGIFKGYSAEDTGAEDLIQRYQMALFVSRISTGWVDDAKWEDGTANNATFKDIEEGDAANYLGAISYANQNGIIEGYTANTFAPYDNITYRDALTMVVRTLGYKGLTYPWGYIEKAVELELTEGIDSDVAYTDNLTRGEVATIIYYAMFAKNSNGVTLAKSIFDVDFKWQNIIVVSTDEYTTVSDKDGAVYAAKEGYVGFKTIDDDGVVGDKVYYVDAKEMGLDKDHDAELAVGSVYMALFKAVDGDFVTLVDSDSALMETVVNNGVTDNEGKPVAEDDMPIAMAIKPYTLVKNVTKGLVSYDLDDLVVYGYQDYAVVDKDGNAKLIGIDANNNIVLWKDGKWTIEWFYNTTLDRYYQYIVDEKNESKDADGKTYTAMGDKTVYINWMDESDFIKWYEAASAKLKATLNTLQPLEAAATAMLDGKAPYAKLNLFDLDRDEDGLAEIAIYKTYSIGEFANSTMKCFDGDNKVDHTAGKDMPSYKITPLAGGEGFNVFVEAGHEAHDTDLAAGFAWINVDDSVSGFKNEDGTYNDGVVLYNWNKTTGEIEIVKYITDKATDDADSYITTGILQAYSTKNGTVTINGVSYPIGYANLSGVMFNQASSDIATRAVWADILDNQYMQYIKAVVCDGRVVKTELVGNTEEFIVVLEYAGITSDGYIAVYGYKTDELVMKVFKINSFNGWKQGDYRYNPTHAEDDGAFDFGSLYTIKSYDAETESYGVYTENVETVLDGATPVIISFKNGYRSVQKATVSRKLVNDDYDYKFEAVEDSAPSIEKMTDADKYVIVTGFGEDSLKSNIFVYDGIVNSADYDMEALMVTGSSNNSRMVLYTGYTKFAENSYDIGYVLYQGGKVLDAAYDDAQVVEDYYLLGSSSYEVAAFNLLTGNNEYVFTSSNINLKAGHVYKTIGGQIIADVTDDCNGSLHNFFNAICEAYNSKDLDYADFITAGVNDNLELTKAEIESDVVLANKLLLGSYDDEDAVDVKIADKLIENTRKIFLVEEDDSFNWYSNHALTEVSTLDLKDNTTYTCHIVYEVATKKVVIYVFGDGEDNGVVADPASKDFTNKAIDCEFGILEYTEGGSDTKTTIGLYGEYTVKAIYDNKKCEGQPTGLYLTGIKTYFGTKVANKDADGKEDGTYTIAALKSGACDLHNQLAADGQGFGVDYTDDANYLVYVNGDKLTADEYTVTGLTCCDLGYMVEITLDNPIKLDMDDVNNITVEVGDIRNNVLTTEATIEANYVISALEKTTVFNTVIVEKVDAKTNGPIDLNKNYEYFLDDGYKTIIG